MGNQYRAGQIVRLRLPQTYGKITEVFRGPVFGDEPVYAKGGLFVKPMNPVKNAFGETTDLLDYYFDSSLLRWMVEVIDSRKEVENLRFIKKQTRGNPTTTLDDSIRYLSKSAVTNPVP